jgi:hypothetical protein
VSRVPHGGALIIIVDKVGELELAAPVSRSLARTTNRPESEGEGGSIESELAVSPR